MPITAVLGAQWGDEGKGKVSAYFCQKAEGCARFQGGPNAGHTIYVNGHKVVFRSIPSGSMTASFAVIGNGTVLNPRMLLDEIEAVSYYIPDILDRLFISLRAHIILPSHLQRDQQATSQTIGTTRMGIGPAYTDKISRIGMRVGEYLAPESVAKLPDQEKDIAVKFASLLQSRCVDTAMLLRTALDRGEHVVAEGAQGALLDIDHGDYPYVTSSNTTIGAVLTGLGITAKDLAQVYVVASAYMTKVGNGPFPTKIQGPVAAFLQQKGAEIDGATNQLRDCGWLELAQLRYAVRLNGADGLIITRLDVFSGLPEVKVSDSEARSQRERTFKGWECDLTSIRDYEQLPQEAKDFLCYIEEKVGIPIVGVSVGPYNDQYICR